MIALSRRGASGQNIAEAAARAHAESLVDAGPAKVGVDEQNANSFLRQNHRAVDAGGRLAFLGKRAGHHNHLAAAHRGWKAAARFAVRGKTRPFAIAA